VKLTLLQPFFGHHFSFLSRFFKAVLTAWLFCVDLIYMHKNSIMGQQLARYKKVCTPWRNLGQEMAVMVGKITD